MNALRRLFVCWIVAVASCMGVNAPVALPILVDTQLIPPHPTPADFIVEHIRGEFPTTGFSIPDPPTVHIVGHTISIDIVAFSPIGLVLPIVTSFLVTADIGLLQEGTFISTARLFVDGNPFPVSTFSDSFAVVPEPSTLLLLGAGLAGIIGLRSTRRLPSILNQGGT